MGGGGGSTETQVIQPDNPKNVPLQEQLTGNALRQLNYAAPFSYYGAGYNLLPNVGLGQVFAPGPNPTAIGNVATSGNYNYFGGANNVSAPNAYGTFGNVNGNSGYGSGLSASLQQLLQLLGGGLSSGGGQQTPQQTQQPSTTSPQNVPTVPPRQLEDPTQQTAAAPQTQQYTPGGGAPNPNTSTPNAQTTPNSGGYPFGTPPATISPGQTLPNSQAGDKPILAPQPVATQDTRRNFLDPTLTAPYYNTAAVLGNVGSLAGQAMPNASGFMSDLFSPNLTQMEQSFLTAGTENALKAMKTGLSRIDDQYENNPFADSRVREQGEMINQYARDLLGTAGQMGTQRQTVAAQSMATPFNLTSGAAQGITEQNERLFNLANAAYAQPYGQANATYSQIPISAPSIIPGRQSSNKSII